MSDSNDKNRSSDLPSDSSEPDEASAFDPNHTLAADSYSSADARSEEAVQNRDPGDEEVEPSRPDDSGHEFPPDNFATLAPVSDLTAAQSVGQTRSYLAPSDIDSGNESVDATRDDAGQFEEPDEFLTATNADQAPEQRIGRYEIKRLLGEGAFGKVFEARDPQLDRIVALKVAKSVAGETQIQRFTREARAAAQLRHPHIIPVYEYGQIEGQSYIVYEFVDGETLRFMNKRLGRITFDSAVDIVREIAEGLDYAHEQGIIHRDMKPDNVMVDPKGGIHVADFGCARSENDRTDLTVDGSILGTPMYMSPEQASGKSSTADGRTDIWSLGVMFYELLSGERPFDGSLTELLHWICNNDPKPLRKIDPKIPIDLETICDKCLNREPSKRFSTAGELAEELTRFQEGEPIKSRRIGPIERSWMWAKRNRTVASLITAVVTVLLLGTFISSYLAYGLKMEQTEHVETQIDLLKESKPSALPGVFVSLAELKPVDGIKQKLKDLRDSVPAAHNQSDASVQTARGNDRDKISFRANMALLQIAREENSSNLGPAVEELLNQMLEQSDDPEFFQVCCDLIEFQKEGLKRKLWKTVENENTTKQRRFCAAVALANYDDPESEEWENATDLSTDLANSLTSLNQIEMAGWLTSVAKIRDRLRPPLLQSFNNRRPGQEVEADRAAVALSRLYKDSPKWLVHNLLPDATPVQVSYIVDSLRGSKDSVVKNEAVNHIRNWLKDETIPEKGNSLADWASSISRQANMAVALIELDPDYQWEHLRWGKDPSLAAEIIERIGPASTSFDILLERLKAWKSSDGNATEDELSGVLLALGEFRQNQISIGQKEEIKPFLLKLFSEHPGARVHSSSKWLLARLGWDDEIADAEELLKQELPDNDKSWHVDMLGNTFIVFDPVPSFKMGLDIAGLEDSEDFGDLPPHSMKIPRRFGVCETEVTIEQYEEFEKFLIDEMLEWAIEVKDNAKLAKQLTRSAEDIERRVKLAAGEENPRLPVREVPFLMALAYCRWVNDTEGTGPSSLPMPKTLVCNNVTIGGAFSSNEKADNLKFMGRAPKATGYRLPTAAEWEYACRGKSQTMYPFGRTERHLKEYAWYAHNVEDSTVHPVGKLKPLSTGLFDMLGNVNEWCLDFYIDKDTYDRKLLSKKNTQEFDNEPILEDHGEEFFEEEGTESVGKGKTRETRGGSFKDKPSNLRPTARNHLTFYTAPNHLGFRLARTYPPKKGN